MITEKLLRRFKDSLLNEDIPLPKGSKSAKLVCHVDLDGLISGITMVHQLVKQGIPKNRIKVEFAQYGDESREKHKHTEKFNGRKNEFVAVTDFAKLPKVKPFDIFSKLTNFKGDEKKFVAYMKSKDFSKVSLNDFKKDFLSKFAITKTQWTESNLKELHEALAAYYKLSNKPVLDPNTIRSLNYQVVNPDFVSDHHSNEQGALSGGKTGEIAVDSPSEAEFLASKYAPGLWGQDDIKAVSMVDSAAYTLDQLVNTIFLEKHFTGPNKKKNLAIILSCIYDNMVKKDREAGKWVIKNANPSLVSAYNMTLKAAGYSGKRMEYLNLLKNGEVEKAKEVLKEIPDILNKGYDRHNEPSGKVMSREDWQKKNIQDLKDATSGYKNSTVEKNLLKVKGKRDAESKEIRDSAKLLKGKMQQVNNFTVFAGTDKRKQYSRFATSLFSVNGKRSPFAMRFWGDFFQIAKNTLYKGKVNFADVNDHVIKDVERFLLSKGMNDFKVEKIIDNMKEKNGGHSDGIWSFQGFDLIKPPSKEMNNYYVAKRIHNKNPNAPTASRIVKEKEEGIIKQYKDLKNETVKKAMSSAIYWTNKLSPVDPAMLKALENDDDRFEEKMKNKELLLKKDEDDK